jgi:hypothetical protein
MIKAFAVLMCLLLFGNPIAKAELWDNSILENTGDPYKIGFAIVLNANSPVFKQPNGDIQDYLTDGDTVWVTSERVDSNGNSWFGINYFLYALSRQKEGWIRSDDIATMDELFTDIKKIAVSYYGIAGLKNDGTVIIVGERDPRMKPRTNSAWSNIVDIAVDMWDTYGVSADYEIYCDNLEGSIHSVKADKIYADKNSNQAVYFYKNQIVTMTGQIEGLEFSPSRIQGTQLPGLNEILFTTWNYLSITRGSTINASLGTNQKQTEWEEVQSIVSGMHHTVVLLKNGTVLSNGQNIFGECNTEKWNNIVEISVGEYHTLGLKSDGTVVAAGLNTEGQCDVQDWRDIVQADGSTRFSAGLTKDNRVLLQGNFKFGLADQREDLKAFYAGH